MNGPLYAQRAALAQEFQLLSDLPGSPNSGDRWNEYETLVYEGLAERRPAQLTDSGGRLCGTRFAYRLAEAPRVSQSEAPQGAEVPRA